MLFIHKNICFYYDPLPYYVGVYYQMIIETIQKFIYNNEDISINITLCNNYYNFNNNNKTIKININFEHTIVKNGGRDVPNNTPYGNIKDDNNNNYLVRIDKYNKLNNSDIIIDYSIPNIKNCEFINAFLNRHIYIASSIYELNFIKENRNILTLTTFINTNEPYRSKLLTDIHSKNIPHVNVNNCFEKNDLQNLYKNTKILINIHQTPHHHTFEELRVLPALELGVIVICEKSPLVELIPYHDYIIWSSYENILDKTIEVLNNYDYYHNLIFSNNKINTLSNLKNINYNILSDSILSNI